MHHIEKLLATKVRILVYAGEMNWYNNWYGQIDWLSKLDWFGQVDFNEAEEKDWYSYVSGQKAGSVKTYLNLAFVKVYNAGFYVRKYQVNKYILREINIYIYFLFYFVV